MLVWERSRKKMQYNYYSMEIICQYTGCPSADFNIRNIEKKSYTSNTKYVYFI